MTETFVQSAFVYPFKSAQGIEIGLKNSAQIALGLTGFDYDRCMMAIDVVTGRMFNHTKSSSLCQIQTAFELTPSGPKIRLSHPSKLGQDLIIDPRQTLPTIIESNVYSNAVAVSVGHDTADKWLSDVLQTSVRLGVQVVDQERIRKLHPIYGDDVNHPMSLADSGPYLFTTIDSLVELNETLDNAVSMENFRPNIVLSGMPDFILKRFRIGEAVFEVGELCTRCGMTTIDQKTGERKGPQPLKALMQFRMVNEDTMLRDKGVVFGVRAKLIKGIGSLITSGDAVEIIETRPVPTFQVGKKPAP